MANDLPARFDTHNPNAQDESRLLDKLEALRDEGKRVRDKWAPPSDIEKDINLFRDGGSPGGSTQKHFSANFIEAFIDRQISQLTDNRPIVRIDSRKVGLKAVAHVVDRAARIVWEEADTQRQAAKMAHLAATMRSAGFYTGYDPREDEISLEPLRIDQVVFDPKVEEAARVSKDADYLSICRVTPLAELRDRYPGRGASVKPDAALSNFRPSEGDKRRTVLSPVMDAVRRASAGVAVERAKVYETWIRDWQRTATGDLMFPGGRLVMHTDDIVLWDGPNPYWDGDWPLDWYDWGVDPEHPWGRSEVGRMRYLQLPFNALMDGLIRNQMLTNILLVEAEYDAYAPELWKKLQSIEDSLVMRTQRRNANAKVTVPPTFGADKLNIARQIFTVAQLLAGVPDVVLGETPGSLQSGVAIEGLQEGANLMTRARASRLEDLYGRIGQKLVSRVFQFFDTDRIAGIVGPSADAESYAKARQEMFFQLVNGKPEPTTPEQRRRALRDFRFTVSPGSSAPGTRRNRVADMLKLHAAGLAGATDVLGAGDFPEPEEMAERAAKELGQRAAAGVPPPPPPRSNRA